MTDAPRILIVNLTRFGDLLQTSPTISALRAAHPGARITLLADRNFAGVCEGIPGIDDIRRTDLDSLGHQLLAGGRDLLSAYRVIEDLVEELRAESFDLALNFSSSGMSAVFLGLLRIPDVRGWSMTPEGHRVIAHPWSRLFATLCLNRPLGDLNLVDSYRGMAGGGPPVERLLFDISDQGRAEASELLQEVGVRADEKMIAMQLGASRTVRMWPTESFTALGRELADQGYRVVLTGGNKERELAAAVARGVGSRTVDACGRTKIPGLAALLERCELLVSGDTGPMHLGAAVGTPIVGLFFGPALPYDTGPYGRDHVLLHAAVPCAPCAHSVSCLDPFCRTEITPQIVARAAQCRIAGDWDGLGALDLAPDRVRVLRTGFDAQGFYQCTRVANPMPAPDEVLRRAYRATWLAALDKRPLPEERFSSVDPAPFLEVGATARHGLELARRLAQVAGRGAPSELERIGAELHALERSLAEHAAVRPEIRPLTQMFRFGQECLPDTDVLQLAHGTAELYGTLAFEADCMTTLLGIGQQREQRHAGLHQ